MIGIVSLLFAAGEAGVIRGEVRFDGPVPEQARIPVDVDAATCGRRPIFASDLVVRDGRVAHAAVVVVAPPEGAEPSSPRLDQKGCTFSPRVQTVTLGAEIRIGNSDPIIHNVHAVLTSAKQKETAFNLGMPLVDVVVTRRMDRIGVHAITCDSGHWWMKAYAVVVPHRLHATTAPDGTFRIEGAPAGTRRVFVWHERLGLEEVEVDVRPNEISEVVVRFTDRSPSGAEALSELHGALTGTPPKETVEARALIEERRARIRAEGRALYFGHCATCHGERGDGRGPSARFLSSRPRDLTRGEFKFRTTASGEVARVEDLYRTLSVGIPGTEMPSFRTRLSSDQRRLMAEYVTTLSPRYIDARTPEAIPVPEAPPLERGAIERGRSLYARLQCGQCHGSRGDGADATQTRLVDDFDQPIRATDLTRPYAKGGRGRRAIYRALTTGLSGTPMPSFRDLLSDADRWDLAAYVESLVSSGAGSWILDPDVGRRSTP
jgi:cytochrome c oxidase cbb3-type subunit 2